MYTPIFFDRAADGTRCVLCHHRCRLSGGKTGVCKARGGEEMLPFYGNLSSSDVDPIEKKPLFHYRPGESVLSIGFVGCNLRCPFCQNWQISQDTAAAGGFVPPEKLVSTALSAGLKQIAYTYSEPLIHVEYLADCMKLSRSKGLANILVTNGCVNDAVAAEIIPLADAANIDLKCFSDYSYEKILGGSLPAVKNFIKNAYARIHTEITTLVIPNFNDGVWEVDQCIDFIASVSDSIPWHISAYHPAYKWDRASTKTETILGIKNRAKQKLLYCYTGNIKDDDNDTFCAYCGALLVKRNGYNVRIDGLVKKTPDDGAYYCVKCGSPSALRS